MTAATQIAIVYATESGTLRRKIVPDDDPQLDRLRLGRGESMLLLPRSAPCDDASCRAAIAAAIGKPPASGRCCIIDAAGDVIGVCHADPALDAHPHGRLVASDGAQPGDRYVAGTFLRWQAALTAPAGTAASWLPLSGYSD